MKNIHIIPTNKPSRLSKDENDRIWLSINFEYGINDNNKQNIYITNSEEIKFDDYITDGYKVWQWKDDSSLLGRKKIILTTDQDLINDGVQSIDDKFLEWFVKNPSCEEVEVTPLRKSSGYYDEKDIWHWDFLAYKIIIPKEEPKHIPYTGKVWEPPKQETLEEVKDLAYWKKNAEEDYLKVPISVLRYITELEERMYSEEDMDNYAEYCTTHILTSQTGHPYLSAKKWFEENKKK